MLLRGRSGKCGRAIIAVAASPLVLAAVPSFATPPSFSDGITTGTLTNASIGEASGIAASRMNTNVLWTHNDSGNAAQVFAMTPAGANLGTYNVTGAGNTDWEDIAVGPGPTANMQYLYVGDIGDNFAIRGSISVYRIPEPTVSDTQLPVTTSLAGAQKLTVAYPDGARDAERHFVVPATRDIYIISKRDTVKYVYVAPYPQATSGTTTMTLVTSLNNANWITAADLSPDGDEIIMRSTGTGSGLLYTRPAGGTIKQALESTPISIPLLSEAQGEAIGFDPMGHGYYTTSENVGAPVHYFDRLPPAATTVYWDNDGVAAGSRSTNGTGLGAGPGTWNTSAVKWYNGSADVPWVDDNDAVFWGPAGGTITLGAAQSVNSLAFKTTGYTLSSSTLTLGGPTVTVDAGVTASIGSVVAGSAGLVKQGPGTLKLTTANTYSGGTTVNAGVLSIVSSSLGAQPAGPGINVTINNGSTLRFDVNGLTLSTNRYVQLGPGGAVVDTQNFNDAIAGVVSGTSLTKIGAGTLTLTNTNTYTGGTIVQAGKLVMNRLHENNPVTISAGTLQVADSSPTLPSVPSGNNGSVSRPSSLTISNNGAPLGTRVYTGTLDLGNNDLIIDYSVASPAANIEDMVRNGYNGGNWQGAGITSSTAATAAASGNYALAVADNAALTNKFSNFDAQSVDDTTVLVKFTHRVDLDLDGLLTPNDAIVFATNYTQNGNGNWITGDVDYDGKHTQNDAIVFATFYNATLPSLPEPGVALGFAGLLAACGVRGRRAHLPMPLI
jgi:autotransporter-associated beta strand protein